MDHQISKLDPKLKEAYDRVMATNIPTPAQPPPPQTINVPQPQTVQDNVQVNPFVVSAPATPPPTFTTIPEQPQPIQPLLRRPTGSTIHIGLEPATRMAKKSGISPLIIAFALIIFLVIYTFVWTKIFNISIPILSSYGL